MFSLIKIRYKDLGAFQLMEYILLIILVCTYLYIDHNAKLSAQCQSEDNSSTINNELSATKLSLKWSQIIGMSEALS